MDRLMTAGLAYREFASLPHRTRQKLVRVMARISEASYRRGFQHGVVIGDRRCVDPADLRFNRSLDRSPYTDSPRGGHTAIERLFMEHPELWEVGFDEPDLIRADISATDIRRLESYENKTDGAEEERW